MRQDIGWERNGWFVKFLPQPTIWLVVTMLEQAAQIGKAEIFIMSKISCNELKEKPMLQYVCIAVRLSHFPLVFGPHLLCSRLTKESFMVVFRGLYGVSGTETRFDTCKANDLPAVLSL